MEYVELVQERIAHFEQQRKRIAIEREVRRLGIEAAPRSPFAQIDSLIIRASKGASHRQARRGYSETNHRELAS